MPEGIVCKGCGESDEWFCKCDQFVPVRAMRYPGHAGALCGACGMVPCKCQEYLDNTLRSESNRGHGKLTHNAMVDDQKQAIEEAYQEGHEAFVGGKKAIDNPYLNYIGRPVKREAWMAGWADAMWESLKESTEAKVLAVNPGSQEGGGRKIDVGV